MQIPQLTYALAPGAALPGQLADLAPHEIATGNLDVALDCGQAVVYGAGYSRVKLPGLSTDITAHFQGFVLYQAIREPKGTIGSPTAARYVAGESVNVLRKGRIWITCNGITTDDSDCYIVFSGTGIGLVRADANTDKAALAPRTKIIKGAGVGSLALVEVNLV